MKIRHFLAVAAAATLCIGAAMAKKPLDHDAFDSWKAVRTVSPSNDGVWAAYMVLPQEGDALLTFRNTKNGKEIRIERGYKPSFTADSRWAMALIKPYFKDTRKAKIDKKKDLDLPQDSLAIVDLRSGKVDKIPFVTSYKAGEKGGNWIAWLSCDTAYTDAKKLKDKDSGRPLVVRNLATGAQTVVKWADDYGFSKDGMKLAVATKPHKSDSTATQSMWLLNLPDTTPVLLLDRMTFFGTPAFSDASDKIAFTASADSVKSGTKRGRLYYGALRGADTSVEDVTLIQAVNDGKYPVPRQPREMNDSVRKAMHDKVVALAGDSIFVNQYSKVKFSRNGKRLVVGVAPAVAPDDTTIVDFEQAALDIWRWDAPLTPPQEKSNLKTLKEKCFPIVINLDNWKEQLISSSPLETVEAGDEWNSDWALVRDPEKNIISQQWNYMAPEDLYIVNVNTGERRKVAETPIETSEMSPAGKYVIWFVDRDYYCYNIATGETVCLTAGMEYPLWDEDSNYPMAAAPYGTAGWTEGDAAFLVYDRYDIWKLDPTGASAPVNLTKGEGRKTKRSFRYVKLDKDERAIKPGREIMLKVFDYTNKENGLAVMKAGAPAVPTIKVIGPYSYTQLVKAKDAPTYEFQRANFSTSPEVYIATGGNFANARCVTDANPQMKDYSWGTAQLVKWHAYNGDLTEGVLYLPEDLDPNKKYPMLVVFYETNSEELYRHYTMEPSWSWVNYPFYVSRGYVVFVPDVHYFAGLPGESAYNYICSGVEDLCKKYPFIDKERIGIDGQSWGGYQTAFLVTRTNMFACAGSGAPVSNMTSAYGGIRWGTGDSRQAQYENGQSRIGRTLWEAPELYIANSPIFHADRVETPLLIMHNDEDGAVPWYQGIEYFMALRRLGKPVWMLQYNGEAHNIRDRKNRKDITKRLQQFFDHYLKGDPMPRWMKEGIDPKRKGQDLGF